jgi:uncharacterized protein
VAALLVPVEVAPARTAEEVGGEAGSGTGVARAHGTQYDVGRPSVRERADGYGAGVPEHPAVTAIHLHPVKSCHRVDVERAVVGRYGLVGDREWQVQGPAGQMMNQRKFPALARVRPVLLEGGLRLEHDELPPIEVARPDIASVKATTLSGVVAVGDAGEEAAAWFERLLGVPSRLTAIAPGYERKGVAGEDLFGQEVSLADAAPVLLANAASHRWLLERAIEPFSIERFRPNVVIDGCDPWAEDTWLTVSVGTVVVDVALPWPRCAIPQVDQESAERRREPALVLRRFRWCTDAPRVPAAIRPLMEGTALFGVGGSIHPEGAVIAVGDPVEAVTTDEALVAVQRSGRAESQT